MPAPGRQIIGLDLMRFGAACVVMLFHLGNVLPLRASTWWGWVGVPVFFVLSGFVISYSAETASADAFLKSRVLRLAPAIWICGSITAAAWLVAGGETRLGHRYIDTMALWPWGPWVDPVYWTLPIEVIFYLLVFVLLKARAFDRVVVAFATMAVCSLTYWLAHLAAQRWPHEFAWVKTLAGRDAQLLLIEHGCYFALGGVLWLTFRHGLTCARALIAAIAYAGGLLQCAFYGRAFSSTSPLLVPEVIWSVAVLLMAAVIWRRTDIDRLLGGVAVPIRTVGLATYPLYLLHDDIGIMIRDALTPHGVPTWCAATIAGSVVIAVSLIVMQFAEPPVRAALRWLLDRRVGNGIRIHPATQDPV